MSADEREIERERQEQEFLCPECDYEGKKSEFRPDENEDEDDQLSWVGVVVLIVLMVVIAYAVQYGVV